MEHLKNWLPAMMTEELRWFEKCQKEVLVEIARQLGTDPVAAIPMQQEATMEITQDELTRCKRAVVVLAEIYKAANGGKPESYAGLDLKNDMLVLTQVLRRLEPLAK